jgi:hypothetical protein
MIYITQSRCLQTAGRMSHAWSGETWFTSSKSKSKLYYDRQSVGQSVLVSGTHVGPAINFSPFSLWLYFRQFRVCWCGAPSLTRSPICTFQFLPGIASAAFLRSESHGTHEHILLSLFLRLPQPGGPGSCIYIPQEQSIPVIPPGIGYTSYGHDRRDLEMSKNTTYE